MDNYEFSLLPVNEQASYAWEFGTYLTARQSEGRTINLYHVGNFFVEIWYDPGLNHVDKIRNFKSLNCLDTYLENITFRLK